MDNRIKYVVVYARAVSNTTVWTPLVLKNKPLHLAGMLNLPGGKIEKDESVTEAALRELKEETGLIGRNEKYMGTIQGNTCEIFCMKVDVDFDGLKPRPAETEKVTWHPLREIYKLPNLMPNLRVTIPLMEKDIEIFTIHDLDGDWRTQLWHSVKLQFSGEENPWTVTVRSVGYYPEEEE